ncbi:MAG TPA: glycosyltransferase family 2 protein [Gaiellaceae bacterium]|nr:glycosyltransferase family 2 protein [Gaiellaceae bacterium]
MEPRVSVIVPARNEAATIGACVSSILEQEVEGGLEVIVADGMSTDGTAELARRAGAEVIPNPSRVTPAALNRGLEAARGKIVVRFDAHSEMPPGYVGRVVAALEEEAGAVNVGGWAEVRGSGPWSRAIAAALRSPAGVGNSRLWRRPNPGERRRDVETVPFGCFPTDVLRRVGGWREDLVRNQDFELNHRLRRAGGRIVFDPDVWFVYRPRESPVALARQYWGFGRYKALTLTLAPDSLRLRQLAPLGLLGALGAAALPSRAARPARGLVLVYALLVAAVAGRADAGWRTAPTLVTIHLCWAAGFVSGLGRLALRRGSPLP